MGFDDPLGGTCHRHDERDKDRASTGKKAFGSEAWPDLGNRAVKIPQKDYVKIFGMWRGSMDSTLPGQEAMFKYVQGENLQRLSIKREMRQLKRPTTGLKIETIAGVKYARGKPVASGPIPWNGSAFDKLVKVPTRTPPPRPASTPLAHEHSPSEPRPSDDAAASTAEATVRPSKNLRTHAMRPHSFGKDRALLWKDPKYHDARPRVDCSKRTDEDMALDTKSVRELLGRPATSDPLAEALGGEARGDAVHGCLGGGGRLPVASSRAGSAMSDGAGSAMSRLSTAHSDRLGTGNTWSRYNRTDKWNQNNTVEVIGAQGGFCVIKQKKKVVDGLVNGQDASPARDSRRSTPGKRLDLGWMATIPCCGRITDPYLKDAHHLLERYYVPRPERSDKNPKLLASHYE